MSDFFDDNNVNDQNTTTQNDDFFGSTDLSLSPLIKKEDSFSEDDFEIERQSYSKRAYRRVRRKRVDGVAVGITVPALRYPLEKPKKKRTAFLVLGIILSAIVAVGVLACCYMVYSFIATFFVSGLGIADNLTSQELSMLTLGISDVFSGLLVGLSAIPFLIIFFLSLAIVSYVSYFLFLVLMAWDCSEQEMAKSSDSRVLLINTIVLLALFAVVSFLMVGSIVTGSSVSGIAIGVAVLIVSLFAYFVVVLVFLIKARKKARTIFKALSEEAQNDYIVHMRELDSVDRRIRRFNRYYDGE